jgi:hypothetical protein
VTLVAQLAFAALAALVLTTVVQPVQTDDLWWHLALGRAYASQGPWLAADPLLHTATGPPLPAAWLADLFLYTTGRMFGFQGLRLLHASLVTAILALAWSLLRRASGSRSVASLLAAAFAALSAYRLDQLRPELATILATLLLYRLLLEAPRPPSWRRVGLAAALLASWANLHGAFLLGPFLLAAAAAGCALASVVAGWEDESARASRLGAGAGLGLLATLINPSGVATHLAWLRAGGATTDLARVTDEWARIDLFASPIPGSHPSPLAWALLWLLLLLTPIAALSLARRAQDGGRAGFDPALIAAAAASLAASLLAVRLLWLAIFPLLVLARTAGAAATTRRFVARTAIAAGSLLLVAGYPVLGDWRALSGTLPRSVSGWMQPYRAARYHGGAVDLIADAGLSGNLYNDYFIGGFAGFWLAPRAREFVNGSLNLPKQTMAAHAALSRRRGVHPGEDFLALLDRHEVDLWLGVRTPVARQPGRPFIWTSAHLERAPGWLPVFRAPAAGVYLRANERNRANLESLAAYFAREGVPFDLRRGFEVGAVIEGAPRWAIAHGVIPEDFEALRAAAQGPDPAGRREARDRLACLLLALGSYERAIEIDGSLLREDPAQDAPARRLVWSLLRLGRGREARASARSFARSLVLPISRGIAAAAESAAQQEDPERVAELIARVPVFTPPEAERLLQGLVRPPAHPFRP